MIPTSYQLELPWPPSVNHYYRHVGHKTLISREGRKYRKVVYAILHDFGVRPLDGDLGMIADFYPPDLRRRDLDNLQKSLWDAIQHGGGYRDDSQIKDFECHMREPMRPDGRVAVQLKCKFKAQGENDE